MRRTGVSSSGVRRAAVPVTIALLVLALVVGILAAAGTFSSGPSDDVSVGPGSGGDSVAPDGGGAGGSPGSAPPGGVEQPPTDGARTDEPQSRFTSVEPSADGRTLTVTFWGGIEECYRHEVLVEETADTVTLTLREQMRDGVSVCVELAKEHTRTVELDRPLGDRRLLPR